MLPLFKSFMIAFLMNSQEFPSNINVDETACMSYAVFMEAENQGFNGKLAIANSIKNRTEHDKYPSTVCKVIKQRSQYSFWKRKNNRLDENDEKKMKSVRDSIKASVLVLTNSVPDNTRGAVSFINMKTASDKGWVSKMKKTVVIDDHTFLKHRKENI